MAVDELAQIKTSLAKLHAGEEARVRTPHAHHGPALAQGNAAELQSLLASNPSLAALGEFRTRSHLQQREALLAQHAAMGSPEQKPAAAAALASAEASFAARHHALSLLAEPFTSSYEVIEQPFLIWELPHPNLDIFRDSQIQPHDSWVKILLNTRSSPNGPMYTDFKFYFLWENPSDYYAVVNATSSLVLSGQAVGWGSSGVEEGNYASLGVQAYLSTIRWSGWGNDPYTGKSNDETPYPYVYPNPNAPPVTEPVGFSAYGGAWFSDARPGSVTLDPQKPYTRTAPLLAIPGRAVTMFEVGLHVTWWFYNGSYETVEDDFQVITLDLATDALGYRARCPMLELEILTPAAKAAGTQLAPTWTL